MKKMLVLAVLGALSAPAFADDGGVTISGYIRAGVQLTNDVGNVYFKPLGGDAGQSAKGTTRVDGMGQMVFKGSEGLGNGNSVIYQVGTRFSPDGTNLDEEGYSRPGTFGSYRTYVGLKGDWGTVKLGRVDDNYGDGKYDNSVWLGESPDLVNKFGVSYGANTGTSSGIKNAIRYDLPSMGGFSGSVLWTAGENKTATKSADDSYRFRADYDASWWDVGAAYEGGKTYGDKVQNYLLAAGVKFWKMQAGIEYNHNKDTDANDSLKSTGLYLTGFFDRLTVGLEHFHQSDSYLGQTAKSGTSILYANYALSKNTKTYAEFLHGRVTDGNANNVATTDYGNRLLVGVQHSF